MSEEFYHKESFLNLIPDYEGIYAIRKHLHVKIYQVSASYSVLLTLLGAKKLEKNSIIKAKDAYLYDFYIVKTLQSSNKYCG